MSEVDLLNSHKFIDGRLVSARIMRLIDAIREYCDELDVHWIPPEARTDGQAAFRIVHTPLGKPPHVIKYVQTEDDFDERILQSIIAGDQRNGEIHLSDFEAWQAAQNLIKQQEYLDRLEEAHDVALHYANSNKNTYKVNDDMVFIEGRPGNQARVSRKMHLGPNGKRGR